MGDGEVRDDGGRLTVGIDVNQGSSTPASSQEEGGIVVPTLGRVRGDCRMADDGIKGWSGGIVMLEVVEKGCDCT